MTSKKRISLIILTICILIILSIFYFFYQKNDGDLPEPSHATVQELNQKFADLTLNESYEKIEQEYLLLKEQIDSFHERGFLSRKINVTSESNKYQKPFTPVNRKQADKVYTDFVDSLTFNQFVNNEDSLIEINSIFSNEQLKKPSIKISLISYKNGTNSNEDINYKLPMYLDTKKRIDSVQVDIKYSYPTAIKSYELDNNTPEIKNENFTLKLDAISQNSIKFTKMGDIKIIGYDVLNADGKALAFKQQRSYSVEYNAALNQYKNNLNQLLKKRTHNKDELVYQMAQYITLFDEMTENITTRTYEATTNDIAEKIVIYSLIEQHEGAVVKTLKNENKLNVAMIYNQQRNSWGVINENGQFISFNLPEDTKVRQLTSNYYYIVTSTPSNESDKDSEENIEFTLYYFNGESLDEVLKTDDLMRISADNFVVKTANGVSIYNENLSTPIEIKHDVDYMDPIIRETTFSDKKDKLTGLFYVREKMNSYIYNAEGHLILPANSYFFRRFSDGLLLIEPNKENDKYYLIDDQGKVLFSSNQYDDISYQVKDRMLKVKKEQLVGFIDIYGNEVIPPIYDGASNFSQGYAAANQGDYWGIIDTKNNVIVPFIYTGYRGQSISNDTTSYLFNDDSFTVDELRAKSQK